MSDLVKMTTTTMESISKAIATFKKQADDWKNKSSTYGTECQKILQMPKDAALKREKELDREAKLALAAIKKIRDEWEAMSDSAGTSQLEVYKKNFQDVAQDLKKDQDGIRTNIDLATQGYKEMAEEWQQNEQRLADVAQERAELLQETLGNRGRRSK